MKPDTSTIDLHLVPIAQYLLDPSVTEIVINRPGELRLERRNGWEVLQVPALNHAWCRDLTNLLRNSANQDLTEGWPLLGARMYGSLRAQVVIPPAVAAGMISVTIRRTSADPMTLPQIVDGGAFVGARCQQSLLLTGDERARLEHGLPEQERRLLALFRTREWEGFFRAAVVARKNIVSSGATGSGKTTLGNALAAMIPMEERIITVEDVAEMRLPHADQVNLFYAKGANGLSHLKPRDLLEACLRMRPDRVLLAELRGEEAFYFIQNVINSGHPGTITTVHASSSKLAFHRMAMLVKQSPEGGGLDLADIMETLYALVDVVVQMERQPGGRRVVTEVYYDPAFAARQFG
jgi:type IV secretion system protein VirB11